MTPVVAPALEPLLSDGKQDKGSEMEEDKEGKSSSNQIMPCADGDLSRVALNHLKGLLKFNSLNAVHSDCSSTINNLSTFLQLSEPSKRLMRFGCFE